jgi:hypothetical protein
MANEIDETLEKERTGNGWHGKDREIVIITCVTVHSRNNARIRLTIRVSKVVGMHVLNVRSSKKYVTLNIQVSSRPCFDT